MDNKKQIGVIGMAVMGSNLALNIAKNGYKVSVYNRTKEKTDLIASKNVNNVFPFYNIKDFVESISIPRKILLMVQSGQATDLTISTIVPYLNKGDIIIDGGNSFYKDTIHRYEELLKKGFNFVGMGISGGEEGALNGPSIMPGCSKEVYKSISKILKNIAAKYKNEDPCVTYIGPNGSGHYVKMIHNGIEYGDMQLIAETYFIIKNMLKLNNQEISEIFNEWNKTELNSYLMEITVNILNKKNEKNEYILDQILDEAANKGTGIWASQDALESGVPLSLITESVFARYISSLKKQRIIASKILLGPKNNFKIKELDFIEHLRCALYLGKIISYAQGFSQLKIASLKNNWNLNYKKIAKIFRSGCIIKAKFLIKIIEAYENNIDLNNLLLSPYFAKISNKYQISLRKVVSSAINNGIPVPCLSSAIIYYDSYRTELLPANLIQAQRDYFGSHMYKLINKKGSFHTNWIS